MNSSVENREGAVFLSLLKNGLLRFGHTVGASSMLARWGVEDAPCVALLYHRVYAREEELGRFPMGEIHVRDLEEQLRWLGKHCRFCTLDEWLETLDGGSRRGPPRVLVTFDDGYRDFIQYAVPVCERLGVRPLVFLATGFVDNVRERPWWDYAAHDVAGDSFLRKMNAWTGKFPRKLIHAEWVEGARRENWKPATENEFARWEEWEAVKNLVDFGAHGRFHVEVAGMNGEELAEDMRESRRRIEDRLGVKVRAYAYPYGDRESLSVEAPEVAQKCGFDVAFVSEGAFDSRTTPRWKLSRCVLPTGPAWRASRQWLRLSGVLP